ncbi:hypothetical protein [Zunongwangia sp.]
MIATKERLYRSQSVKEARKEKIDDGVLILETRTKSQEPVIRRNFEF